MHQQMHHHQAMHQHQHQQRTSTGICLEMAAFSDVGAICSEASCRRQVRAAVKAVFDAWLVG